MTGQGPLTTFWNQLGAGLAAGWATLLLAALLVLLGSRLGGLLAEAGEERSYRLARAGLTGLVLFGATLQLASLLGLPWSRPSLLAMLLALGGLAAWAAPAAPASPAGGARFGWGDGVALVALAATVVSAATVWSVNPDFIYHWGIKGKKFFFAGGIDYPFLASRWNWMRHPDYPNLLPSLFGATGIIAGAFREPAMMLWTPLSFLALLASAREVLRRAEVGRFAAQSTLAILALCGAAFGIGHLTFGGPDWWIALVPLAAWPYFLRPPSRRSDLAIGLLAALAAGAKMEGLPLAAFLGGLYLAHRGPWRGPGAWRQHWRALPRLVLPGVVLVVPWAFAVLRYRLVMEPHGGPFELGYAGVIARAVWEEMRSPDWHGAALCLLLLPALLLPRATRWLAGLCLLQLAFYAYVYLASPYHSATDVAFFVKSNFARLAFHVVPTTLVACGIAFDRWLGAAQHPQNAAVSPSPQISPSGLS